MNTRRPLPAASDWRNRAAWSNRRKRSSPGDSVTRGAGAATLVSISGANLPISGVWASASRKRPGVCQRPFAEGLDEGKVGGRRLELVAPAPQDDRASLPRIFDQIDRQPALPHAGLAGEEDHLAACLLRFGPTLSQLLLLRCATDEPSSHQLLQRCSRRRSDVLDAQRRKLDGRSAATNW